MSTEYYKRRWSLGSKHSSADLEETGIALIASARIRFGKVRGVVGPTFSPKPRGHRGKAHLNIMNFGKPGSRRIALKKGSHLQLAVVNGGVAAAGVADAQTAASLQSRGWLP